MIQMIDASFFDAVQGVNLEIRTGECVVFVGMSGAGKSTTTMLIGGVIAPTSGSVLVDGVPPTRHTIHQGEVFARVREQTMFVYRTPSLLKYHTVADSINWTGSDHNRMAELLDLVGFSGSSGDLVGDLTSFQRFQVGICKAVVHSPKILVLDELWHKLPLDQREPMWEVTKKLTEAYNTTTIIVSHDFHEAKYFGARAYGVHNGRVALLPELTEQSFFDIMGAV